MKTMIKSVRRASKLSAALLTLAMAGLLGSGNAAATGFPVVDAAHIQAQVMEFGQQAARWGEQGRQWYKEYEQFMQQYNSFLSKYQNMQSSFGVPQGTPMEPVADDFMVRERCGDRYGSGTAGILGRLTGFTTKDNPQQKRWMYCNDLQRMRNKQYNEMVAYLQKTMPAMNKDLQDAGNNFSGGQTAGEMDTYASKLNKVNGDIARTNEEFDARMTAYDTYARATEITQGSLTRSTLRGGSGLLQQVSNGLIMREALCGSGQCD